MRNPIRAALLALSLVWAAADPASAQFDPYSPYSAQALLFSNTEIGGTPRIQAMGGASSAIGGDLSAAYSNPAGLGFMNRSQASIALGVGSYGSTSDYLNPLNGLETQGSENAANLHVNQLGVAFHTPPKGSKNFKGGAFAITLTRLRDFNRSYVYEATHDQPNLFTDYLLSNAQGVELLALENQFVEDFNGEVLSLTPAHMGYWTFLVNPVGFDDDNTDYFGLPESVPETFLREEIDMSGSQNEVSASYGANFGDRFYIGAGLGIQWASYTQERNYVEAPFDTDTVQSLFHEDRFTIDMTGVNLKVGATFRPHQLVLVAAHYQSPTWSSVSETYEASLGVSYNPSFAFDDDPNDTIPGVFLGDLGARTPEFEGSYALRTPGRVGLGVTVFIKKMGFLTANAEWVDYASARLSSPDLGPGFDFDFDNDLIENDYRSVWNLRFGAEARIKKRFYLRGGYALYPSPYAVNEAVDSQRDFITGGLGYRGKKFSLDFALINSRTVDVYTPYAAPPGSDFGLAPPIVDVSTNDWRGVLSFVTYW